MRIMRRKTAIKNNNLLKTVQLLLFTTVIVACFALAKYRTAMGSSVVAIMANPKTIFTDQVNLSSLKPGGSITSNFVVKNYNENGISDVSMIYVIKIETGKYLPLEFTINKINDGQPEGENLLQQDNSTLKIEMPTEKYEQEYQITVKWKDEEKNYLYSDEIDYVKIIVDSYQKSI